MVAPASSGDVDVEGSVNRETRQSEMRQHVQRGRGEANGHHRGARGSPERASRGGLDGGGEDGRRR